IRALAERADGRFHVGDDLGIAEQVLALRYRHAAWRAVIDVGDGNDIPAGHEAIDDKPGEAVDPASMIHQHDRGARRLAFRGAEIALHRTALYTELQGCPLSLTLSPCGSEGMPSPRVTCRRSLPRGGRARSTRAGNCRRAPRPPGPLRPATDGRPAERP